MCSQNQVFGNQGEDRAVAYLKRKGYRIEDRNWRYKHTEIDIVARKGQLWVFVEVKSRKSLKYGFPEENIHSGKIESVQKAALAYLSDKKGIPDIRFDVVAICADGYKVKIDHFEDAF